MERDEDKRAGLTTDERERIKAFDGEVRELRQRNEIPRSGSPRRPSPMHATDPS
jgi:hypothetical protein